MLIDISQLKFIKNVHGIIHIGAHDCEERMLYLTKFPNITDNEIIWIDALKSKVDSIKLQNSNIRIFNECISNTDNETVTFNVTNNLQSSSFLKLKEHLIEHPDIYEIEKIEIKTKTLKTFYKENNFNYKQFNFMALDIQGAELLALKGAEEILNFVDYIYIEVNTKELYENCGLLFEIEDYLTLFGFKRDNIFMTPHGWGDAFYSKHIFPINNQISITYGLDYMKIDITTNIFNNHSTNGIIHIPVTDGLRGKLYGDPLFGIIKKLYITNGDSIFTIEHDDFVNIDTNNNKLYINENVENFRSDENTKIEIMEPIINKKYTFTIMAIFKNETMNLKVWLDHYLWQGVEHFYLIDNNSNDNPLNILQDYIDRGIVTYYFKPEKHQQVEIYRYVFDNENIKEKTKWLCICDLDEFFFGTTTKLVNVLENEFDNYDVIYTHSFFYGSDNLINHPKDIRTSIVHRTHDTINGIKYIFKPSTINNSSEIWIHWLVEPGTLQKKSGQNETFHDTNFRLNHYICQSLEYFQNVKMTRGDVSVSENEFIRTMEVFNHYEKTAVIKDDILKQIIENNLYDKNGEIMKFYDENNNIIDNNSIEYIEQELVNKYILEDDIVLELGARYGTVSCSINKKLKNKHNQISVEPDDRVWNALELNKIKNNCNFNIVKGFISNKKLDLTNLGEGLSGYGSTYIENNNTKIPSFSLNETKTKFKINNFNVLVADCEGFLEIFFDENPDLYESLRLIIFEADYADKCNYYKIRQKLILNKFCKILEGHQNVWIKPECYQLSNNIKIKYGIRENNVDVTNVVYKNYNNNTVIFIPDGDGYRSNILGDPLHGIIKSIFIHDNIDNIKEISHNQQACIDLTTNKLYIGEIPEIFKMDFSRIEYENIHLKYYVNDIKSEPNFSISMGNFKYDIYKIENVEKYEYKFCSPEINIVKINEPLKQTPTYYFIFDDYGLHAFAHWVYESFIFFPILEELNKLYPNIKILTTNKKKYVRNLINFVGIQNEIVYEITDTNNICFIPPILALNHNIDTQLFNHFISNFINRIQINSINFDYNNEILFLPRNKVDNYFPDDKISIHLLRERRDQNEINYISEGVIENGGIVLNTYEINNFFIQFSLIMNSKNIILDYGSSYAVNCIACKNKNIIVLNSSNINHHIEFESYKNIHNIIEKNNKVTILTNYNNYEDIENILL